MAVRVQQTTTNNVINQTSVVTTSSQQVNVDYKKRDDKAYQQLAASLNISVEQLKAIIETKGIEFVHYSPEKQVEVIKDFNKTAGINYAETTSNSKDNVVSEEKSSFNKAEFNSLSKEEKQNFVLKEFAKNIFIYGAKDKDGNVINGAVPHSEEEWELLGEEKQQALVKKFGEFLKSDEKLSVMLSDFQKKFDSKGDNEKEKLITMFQDMTFNVIQTANQEGKSVLEYMMMDDSERLDAMDKYLTEQKKMGGLSDVDNQYIKKREEINKNVASYVKEQFGEKIEDNITSSQAEDYLKYYNLTYKDVRFAEVEKKNKNGEVLSTQDQRFYERYKKDQELESLNEVQIKAKAENLRELEKEYNQLKQKIENGEQLSEVEAKHLNMLEKTVNSHEAEHLRKVKLAQPETSLEKNAVEFMQSVNSEVDAYIKDDRMNVKAKCKAIEERLASMPEDERAEFLKAIIKFDNSESSIGIYKHFLRQDEYKSFVKNIEFLDKSSLVALECDEKVHSDFVQTAEEAYASKNEEVKARARRSLDTHGRILVRDEYNKKEEYDTKKLNYNKSLARIKEPKLHKLGIDVAVTMKGDEAQGEAVDVLQNGKYADDGLQVHITDRAFDLNVANQEKAVCTAMDKSAEATKNVSEKDIISKLDTSVQTNVFGAAHQNINKWFEGKDAIKYSNSLADQIQNCAPENQLAMHNEMMTSKYSEVQEHAASNIGNYHPDVQQGALESVYRSGNEKAIGNAIESFVSAPKNADPRQQQAWKESNIQQTIIGGLSNEQGVLDLAQRIRSGQTLTSDEYNSLTAIEKSQYKMACFKALPAGKQIAILTQITDTNMKKAIYKHIATTDKAFLKDLIESSADTAAFIAEYIPDTKDLVASVAEFKGPSNIAYANLYQKITNKESNNTEDYASNPNSFNGAQFAFLPRKNGKMFV